MVPSRRALLQAAAAVVLGAPRPRAQTAKYDLLIAGGRVVDPASRRDGLADVAISRGRIAAVAPSLSPGDANEVLDARGALVTPGLIDIHVHASAEMPPAHCLSTGTTAMVDAGSGGADTVAEIVRLAEAAPNRMRVLLNLGRSGLGAVPELLDFAQADVAAARAAVERHRDRIIGVKARLSRSVAGTRDLDAIRRAHEITVPLGLTLMVHVGQTASPLPDILELLRPGDIVTHVYAPPPNGMLDGSGRVLPEVRAARERGIVFDVGNGRTAHITWDVVERALQQDFPPDTISSDLTAPGRTDRVFDFPTVLSKFLLLGMPVDQVIARATANAAGAIPAFRDLGTLAVGRPADVAVLDLQDGDFEFVDNERTPRRGRQKLVTRAVVASGRRVG
jgi:dihydroorotase